MDQTGDSPQEAPPRPGTVAEVLRAFAVLGVTSFGGPVAHLGFFRADLVERRRWLGDADYGDLVVLGQFLPGPASSQVGFGLGLLEGLTKVFYPPASDIVIFIVMIIVLLVRPAGLFGKA